MKEREWLRKDKGAGEGVEAARRREEALKLEASAEKLKMEERLRKEKQLERERILKQQKRK